MLSLDNVSKIFNDNTIAIDSVSLEVHKKEFVMILGPSGSGKTTIVNLMAGYDFPTSGRVIMKGKNIVGPSFDRGVISQVSTLFPWYNVTENIEYGLKINGIGQKERKIKVEEMLENIGLRQFSKHYPYELSGGMKQRVSLARSLVNKPEVLLFDEPLGALDALTRISMQKLIHRLWLENGLTCVMITHDIEEALKLGTKIYVLSESPGRVLKTYYPGFYKKEDWEKIELDPNFIKMKNEIMDLIR